MQNKGFSLLEMVFVLAIMGILSTTALPKYWQIHQEAKKQSLLQSARVLTQSSDWLYQRAALQNKAIGLQRIYLDKTTQITLIDGYPLAEIANITPLWETGLIGIADTEEATHRLYFGFSDNLQNIKTSQCYLQVETVWQSTPLQSLSQWQITPTTQGC